MKRICLLSVLLVGSLLLIGCNKVHNDENYVEYGLIEGPEDENYSEYGLIQWPNGPLTIQDFEKGGYLSEKIEREKCDSPENACVDLFVREDGSIYTPYEYNTIGYESDEGRYISIYHTDLKTFRKLSGLEKASPEYVRYINKIYVFDPYQKSYLTREEWDKIAWRIQQDRNMKEAAGLEITYTVDFTGELVDGLPCKFNEDCLYWKDCRYPDDCVIEEEEVDENEYEEHY